MTNPRNNYQLRRQIGMTYCAAGSNDLQPENVLNDHSYWEILEDFHAGSYQPRPTQAQEWEAWAPAYMPSAISDSVIQADLLVVDLENMRLSEVQKQMRRMDLSSIIYETEYSTPANPSVRLALILDRPVDALTYAVLWCCIALELFDQPPMPEYEDFRMRYKMPRMRGNYWCMRFTDGNPIAVDAVLSLQQINERSVASASKVPVKRLWRHGSPAADF
jgi:hypothetical protein